jgi:uncharacterized protein YggE
MFEQHTIPISVKGSSEAKFVSVTYNASVTTRGTTGPEAKKKAHASIEAIKRVVLDHAKMGEIDTERLRTSFAVDTYRNNSGEFAGYQATYAIKFKGKNIGYATSLHDMLTSISGVESPTPNFNLDDDPELYAKAFNAAVAKGEQKFKDECAALKLDPAAFKLVSWSVRDEVSRGGGGKMMAFYSPQLSMDSLGLPGSPAIEPGKATNEWHVTFLYVRN